MDFGTSQVVALLVRNKRTALIGLFVALIIAMVLLGVKAFPKPKPKEDAI